MEVKCPNCSSRFNLPDDMVKTGRKLRCSICRTVFALETPADPLQTPSTQEEVTIPEPEPSKPLAMPDVTPHNTVFSDKLELEQSDTKSKKKKLTIIGTVLLFLLCVVGAFIWHFVFNREEVVNINDAELAEKVKLLTMRNVRQYIVDNEKVGKVFVIEGRVVNEFPTPKEFIKVRATIFDKDKKPLAEKIQTCGTQLSTFQLQVLSEKEMESFLNNKIEILTNNVNVKTGAEVPFMVLFYAPPESVAEFEVRIVDVRDSPKIMP
ncbi:MAG: zinc-ribbon domain-containing protein [Desulfovibrionaceae bacterium]|nr:zinc-ribbon domain-containing protein [Desulfovibrionaceae bacterium]